MIVSASATASNGSSGAVMPRATRKRVAIMQPYFFPYAGYFRLFAAVDEFVIFDCVQFPARGRVHRTEVTGQLGKTAWLTLPLAHHPRETRIVDLQFARGARAMFDERLAAFPWIASAGGPHADRIRDFLFGPLDSPIAYLESGVRLVATLLGFEIPIRRSSTLDIDPALRSQDRVIAIARALDATDYVNAPGGRALYDAATFERCGLRLGFLGPYEGHYFHLLPALMNEAGDELRRDIVVGAGVSA